MTYETIYFKLAEVRQYEKETGAFTVKAYLYDFDKTSGVMSPCYTLTETGRKIEMTAHITGHFFRKLCTCNIYRGWVTHREEEELILSRIDRTELNTSPLLSSFLRQYIKRVKAVKELVKDFQAGGFSSLSDFFKSIPPSKVNAETMKKILTDLESHEQYAQLQDLLEAADCSPASAAGLFISYGGQAVEQLKNDPFHTFMEGQIDWKSADKLFLYFGNDKTAPIRCRTAVYDVLQYDVKYNGSVCTQFNDLIKRIGNRVNRESMQAFQAADIEQIVRNQAAVMIDKEFGNDVYLPEQYRLEQSLAVQLNRILHSPKRSFPRYTPMDLRAFFQEHTLPGGVKLSAEQISVIEEAMTNPVTMIHGDPGCGKTVTIRGLVDAIQHFAPSAAIRLCAPTGKAARNLAHITEREASTLHSLIFNIKNARKSPKDLGYLDFILIDEAAMLDNERILELLELLDPACRLVLIGDANQLPSIGPGIVFKQLLEAASVMSLRLTKVFRQKAGSEILRLARDIVQYTDNEPPVNPKNYTGDVQFISSLGSKKTCAAVERKVQELMTAGVSPDDILVLSPIRGKDLGTRNLNAELANILNLGRSAQTVKLAEFRVGDKVIQGKNLYENGRMSVYNGAAGRITGIDPNKKEICVDFPDSGIIRYDSKSVEMLELAYALTIHKFQGSEIPYVILPMDGTFLRMLNRQLVYTAVTRAKVKLIIIGSEASFKDAVCKDTLEDRHSHLGARLDRLCFTPS